MPGARSMSVTGGGDKHANLYTSLTIKSSQIHEQHSFSERPCFRKLGGEWSRWKVIEEDTWCPLDSTYSCAQNSTQALVQTPKLQCELKCILYQFGVGSYSPPTEEAPRSPSEWPFGLYEWSVCLFFCRLGPLWFYSPFNNNHPSESVSTAAMTSCPKPSAGEQHRFIYVCSYFDAGLELHI